MRPVSAVPAALVTSGVIHAGLLGAGVWFAEDSPPAEPVPVTVVVDRGPPGSGIALPEMQSVSWSDTPDEAATPKAPPVMLHGGDRMARPDQAHPGRGGTDTSPDPALNLSDSMDSLTLDRDPMNAFHRSQVQRLRTSADRRSRDDRRATPNPMELSFLASGDGTRQERRKPSRWDPSRGIPFGVEAMSRGSVVGDRDWAIGEGNLPSAGGSEAGREKDAEGRGVADGAPGKHFHRSAKVALARPLVTRSRAAVPSNRRGRPNDTQDSSQEVASAVRALLHASSAGGKRGSGAGGIQAPGAPGSSGARGAGSKSRSAGHGAGPARTTGTDPRLWRYLRALKRKVDPHWEDAFPDWAILDGRGGLAVVSLRVLADGRVRNVRVIRGSGIGEFDVNLVRAVQAASPFGPLPRSLGKSYLDVTITFDALNPIVPPPKR